MAFDQEGLGMDRDRPQFQYHLIREDTVLESSLEEVRILLVVDGALQVNEDGPLYLLKKSDYLLVNVLEEAKLKVSASSYVAMLSIPYFDILRASERLSIRFRMCSLDGREGHYQEMLSLLQELVMALAGDPRREQLRAAGLSCLVLQALIDHFAVSSVAGRQADASENRTTQIFQYIWSHYRGPLTMTEIASRLFLSRSSASRMFRQAAGESFPEYLNRLRLRAVIEELTHTDRSITDIALDSGFSSPAVLNRTFKAVYGISPSEYRAANSEYETETGEDQRRNRIVYEIIKEDQRLGLSQGEVHMKRISLENPNAWKHWKNRLLNIGQMASLMSARMQEQVLFLGERLKIEYMRLWNPFSPQMMILGEREGEYNFTFLDDVLDFLVDHHYKLFLDLTPRQERNMANERRVLGSHSGPCVFQNLSDWLRSLEALLRHLRSRYQPETVQDWIFELTFWLNNDRYYAHGDQDDKILWNQSVAVIRSILPGARIAGPGMILHTETEKELREVAPFLENEESRPDIFTSIHFPYFSENQVFDRDLVKNPSRVFFQQETEAIDRLLRKYGFAGEYWVTDCGISISNRNYMQDSCYRAAAMLELMLKNLERLDSIGIFFASDLLGAYSDSGNVLSGSGGLLSRSGIRKPVYYAYRFLRQLGKQKLWQDDQCIATMNDPGDIRILCWNRKNLGPRYYMVEEDTFRAEELDSYLENTDPYWMEIMLEDLEQGRPYRIRQRILNNEQGSVLHKWMKLGGISDLIRDDLEYLQQTSVPDVVSEVKQAGEDGVLRIPLRMEPNELRLIHITNMK